MMLKLSRTRPFMEPCGGPQARKSAYPKVTIIGILLAFWEWGYPDLPAYSPHRGSIKGLVRPSFDIDNSRPSRGAKPREADDTKTSKGISLLRLPPEERRFLCKAHLVRFE